MFKTLGIFLSLLGFSLMCFGDDDLIFDTTDLKDFDKNVSIIEPWKTIQLEPNYGGFWVVTGDVDGDGNADIVSARNVNANDVHYTSTVAVQRLDGSVIWTWSRTEKGRKELHHDVACQIYDWDGDGNNEVIICADGELIEFNGATGKIKRRLPLPENATDCLVFANLSGNKRATDVLVKTRYSQIWAYNYDWDLLWTVKNPGGYRTAHQALPIDIDHDGKDEIMAGYALLNPDGSVRWVFQSEKVDQKRGHLDCCRVLKEGRTPEEFRLALTLCGANAIALVDGNGKNIWEVTGHHFESINIGKIYPDIPGPQILVDIDHRPRGESPIWILDQNGRHLGQLVSTRCRQHTLVDWTGDGISEFILADTRGLYNNKGERIAFFNIPETGNFILHGDMTGDGLSDITLTTDSAVYIFENKNGKKIEGSTPLGCGVNYTLY